jgi:hypothetical protein
MQKRKNGYPNSGYPYLTRISGYLPSSPRSVSDLYPKLQYPSTTRIRPEYKNTESVSEKTDICIIRIRYPMDIPDPFSPLVRWTRAQGTGGWLNGGTSELGDLTVTVT